MRYNKLTILIPCALLLSACTIVTPTHKDNDTRSDPCVEGDSDNMAQQFYDYRILYRSNNIIALRPYLSNKLAVLLSNASRDNNHRELLTNDPLSNRITLSENIRVANASTVPNRGVRNTSLRVDLKQGDQSWRNEVLMIQKGQCWIIDDVRYSSDSVHTTMGTLRQSIENR